MICYRCGNDAGEAAVCIHCGADVRTYREILTNSEALYNKGLELANVRDLSGAIDHLKSSVKYNKYNTKARNLLGLIYYERGDIVYALREWVISNNLAPNKTAERYLDELQKSPADLEKQNQTIKKYNQALSYAKSGNRDLALIQLKKVMNANPKFVTGHQLLALLYMQDGKYEDARKALNLANKIDVRNPITLKYAKEVKEQLRKSPKKKRRNNSISYTDGNETIVMPRRSVGDLIEGSRTAVFNLLAGIVIGLLVCFFLVVPTIRQNAISDASGRLIDTNNQLSTTTTDANSLSSRVASLEEELAKYTGSDDAVTSYDNLMAAQTAYQSEDNQTAATHLATINRDLLSDSGKAIYDQINTVVTDILLSNAYDAGVAAINSGNYEEAKNQLEYVYNTNSGYRDGEAMYYYADALFGIGDNDKAQEIINAIKEAYPDSSIATRAQQRLDDFNNQ